MNAIVKPKSRPRIFPLRVIKGGFAPADASTASTLRNRGMVVGDLVFAQLRKPRNPAFNRLVHQFGRLLLENLDVFTGKEAHDVLKRLQVEGDIGCDHVALIFPGLGPCEYRIPRSLSFESMEEGEFKTIYREFSTHVARTYWKDMTPEAIERMAELMASDT